MGKEFDFSKIATEKVGQTAGECYTLLHAVEAVPGLLSETVESTLLAIRNAAEGELNERLGQLMGMRHAWAGWAADDTAPAEDDNLRADEET